MIQTLNNIADAVEEVLRANRAPAEVTGGRVTDYNVSVTMRPSAGTTVAKIMALRADIALALGVDSVSIGQSDGLLCVTANRPRTAGEITLRDVFRRCNKTGYILDEYTALLGLTDENAPLGACLPSPQVAHILIAGTTGSGKTSLAHTLITSLTATHRPHRLGVVVLDPKRRNDSRFTADVSHHLIMPIAHTPDEQAEALRRVVVAMEAREIPRDINPRIVVFADELADTALAGGGEALRHLSRIAARGREAGIHIVACTQNPSAKSLTEDLRRNFPLRLVGRVSSTTDARLASGRSNTGAEALPGKGSFLAVTDTVIRFQAALADMHISNPCRVPEFEIVQQPVPIAEIEPLSEMPQSHPVAPTAPTVSEININTAVCAMRNLRNAGQPVNRSSVLAALGKPAGGAHWRQLSAIWNTALNAA